MLCINVSIWTENKERQEGREGGMSCCLLRCLVIAICTCLPEACSCQILSISLCLCFYFGGIPTFVCLPLHTLPWLNTQTHTQSIAYLPIITYRGLPAWWLCVILSQFWYRSSVVMISGCRWWRHPHWLAVTVKKHGIIPIDRQWHCVKKWCHLHWLAIKARSRDVPRVLGEGGLLRTLLLIFRMWIAWEQKLSQKQKRGPSSKKLWC